MGGRFIEDRADRFFNTFVVRFFATIESPRCSWMHRSIFCALFGAVFSDDGETEKANIGDSAFYENFSPLFMKISVQKSVSW